MFYLHAFLPLDQKLGVLHICWGISELAAELAYIVLDLYFTEASKYVLDLCYLYSDE